MPIDIDIAIITHNRDEQLFRCVTHICCNSQLPQSIIIIHSQPPRKCTQKAQISNLCRRVGVSLTYVHVPHKGISYSRNIALKHINSPIFGFIDDDEYSSNNWIKFAAEYFKSNESIHVLSGPKTPTNPENYSSKIWYEIYKSSLNDVTTTNFVTSSNTFYKTSFIKKNNIVFDNDFSESSEDCVFSFKLSSSGAKMIFHKNLVVYHDFRTHIIDLFHQWFGYGKSTAFFQQKYYGRGRLSALTSGLKSIQGYQLISAKNAPLAIGLLLIDLAYLLGTISHVTTSLISVKIIKKWPQNI